MKFIQPVLKSKKTKPTKKKSTLERQTMLSKLLSNFKTKIFAHSEQFRSDSENGLYAKAVLSAVTDQSSFENFKKNRYYNEILEHVTCSQGAEYLQILINRDDGFLKKSLDNILINDKIGNPVKFKYKEIDAVLSPTTLRYIKVASDLNILFGPNLNNIAEIGCGYGGQCLVNDALLSYKHATLFDLPFVNKLIERYLDYTLFSGSYETTSINKKKAENYDLVISNYAFSELPKAVQLTYISKVLMSSKRGYLTMNSGIGSDRDHGKLTFAELKNNLPAFDCIEEDPLTYSHNYIIIWGHDHSAVDKYFKRKYVNY